MPPIPFKFLAASPMVLARTAVDLVLSVEHHLPRITPAVRSASPRRTESKKNGGNLKMSSGREQMWWDKRPGEKAPKRPVA